MFADEVTRAKLQVSKARLALKLSLNQIHGKTAVLLQALEDGQDVSIGLATLRSQTNEVWSDQETLERTLGLLGLLERLSVKDGRAAS